MWIVVLSVIDDNGGDKTGFSPEPEWPAAGRPKA